MGKSVYRNVPKPPETINADETHENVLSWSRPLNEMFDVPKRDCTPAEILATMGSLTEMKQPRFGKKAVKALSLDEIREHAEIRNVQDCTAKRVRECLIVLYREGKILHRSIADVHRFMIK